MYIQKIQEAMTRVIRVLAGYKKKMLKVALFLFFNIFFSILILVGIQGESVAKNVGVIGKIYLIAEEDLLVLIKTRLQAMQDRGEIRAANIAFRDRSIAYINRPTPVLGITNVQENKTYYFDPSIIVQKTITDQNGNIIAKKGDVINPLKTNFLKKSLKEKMIFIDGDNQKQVDWALALYKKDKANDKIILTSGSPIDLMKKYQKRFYFDQYGKISAHFNLKHVPTVIEQAGLKLKISEVKL
jgi:conjugal transfer pilus assembly protein TraW